MIEAFMPPKSKHILILKEFIDRDDSMILVCGKNQLKQEVIDVLNAMDYRNYFIFS